jgi:hypothetical protein
MAKKAEKAQASVGTSPSFKVMPMDNRATICDYNQNLLGDVVGGLKVGQKVSLRVTGEVTKLEEHYSSSKRGEYGDPYGNRCEIELKPTSVSVGSGNMVGEINREKKKRGGGYYDDEEGD